MSIFCYILIKNMVAKNFFSDKQIDSLPGPCVWKAAKKSFRLKNIIMEMNILVTTYIWRKHLKAVKKIPSNKGCITKPPTTDRPLTTNHQPTYRSCMTNWPPTHRLTDHRLNRTHEIFQNSFNLYSCNYYILHLLLIFW